MATEGAFGFFGLSSFHALCVHAFVFVGLSWLICIVLDVRSSVSEFGSLECLLGVVLLDVSGVFWSVECLERRECGPHTSCTGQGGLHDMHPPDRLMLCTVFHV